MLPTVKSPTPLSATFCLVLGLSIHSVSTLQASDIVVTNSTDLVNGNTANPSSLVMQPGPDGISLREGILAANAVAGPHVITFDGKLNGETIAITRALFVTRDYVEIRGNVSAGGSPAVTIDGAQLDELRRDPPNPDVHEPDLLTVIASGFRISHLEFRSIKHRGLVVQAGPMHGSTLAVPQSVRRITIEDNIFENRGFSSNDPSSDAIRIWTDILGGASSATISDVEVRRNRIAGFAANGVIAGASGENCTIARIIIDSNELVDTGGPIEVNTGNGSHNRVTDVRISSNTMTGSGTFPRLFIGHVADAGLEPGQPPGSTVLWPAGSDNRVENVEISRNRVDSTTAPALEVSGGQTVDGTENSRRNLVQNVRVTGNVFRAGSGIAVFGGGSGGTTNAIDQVVIVNNTILTSPLAGLRVDVNRGSGTANSITGLTASNTIFVGPTKNVSGPEDDIAGDISPIQVSHSITSAEGFAGINGNLSADPFLIGGGDHHLRAGSPAIDRGAGGAPESDADCRQRVGVPDIGAYEWGSVPTIRLTLQTAGLGTGRVATEPRGLDCGGATSFPATALVRLIGSPDPGWTLSRWIGDPSCNDGTVLLDRDMVCVAVFGAQRRRAVRH